MNIIVRSKDHAYLQVLKEPKKYHVISIRDPEDTYIPIDLCKKGEIIDVFKIYFHDVWAKMEGYDYPKPEHIHQILHWVKERKIENLLVHCFAGVSRSSSIAVLINAKVNNPKNPLDILDENLHWPNELIIKIGSEILNRPELIQQYEEFTEKQKHDIRNFINK